MGKGELDFDENGKPLRMLGTIQDITEGRQAESALNESEEKFRTIFQSASEGIFIADNQGNYTEVNDTGLKMLGYTKEEILQLNLKDLIPEEELAQTVKTFSKIRNGETVSSEHHLICRDGKLLPVEINASVLPNGSLLGMVRDISDRRQAELEKDYLLSFNKRLIENSPIGTLLYKVSSGQCVLANNAAKTAIGAPIEKLLAQNFWEIPSWKNSRLLENALITIETGKGQKFIAHFRTTFGRKVWIDCQMVSMFMDGEKHLLLMIIDITERMQAEEALKESEEKFRTIFENASDGILIADLEAKRFVMGNKMICRMLGYDCDEIIKLSVADIHPKEDLSKVIEAFEKQLENIEIAENIPVKRKDGSIFFADINSCSITINGVNYLLGVFRDNSERKRAEDSLRSSEDHFKSIIELAADGILLGSAKGVIIGANHKICTITGYSENELVGNNISFLFSAEQLNASPLRYDILDLGIVVRNERIITRKDGAFIPIEMNTKKMPDNTYQAIIRDITERQKSEELKLKIEKSEYENLLKSKFMANLSHEIRNPLNAIIGLNSLIAKTGLTQEQEKFNNAIGISSGNLLNILNDILDFSTIEANKIVLNFSDFNIRYAAEEVMQIYEAKAIAKNITLSLSVSNDIPELFNTDQNKLKQIIINLLGNALKFTAKGAVELIIELRHKEKDNITIEFTVKDTGIGIDQSDFDKIFQSFTQLDSSTTKTYSGTGLGLSICKSYVEMLGGSICFTSILGVGSEFSFGIPLTIGKSKQIAAVETQGTENPLPKGIPGMRINILVAEDDGINRLYLTSFLKSQNFNVDSAGDGFKVLELFNKNKYDIILMDCQMPKMDGFEATRKIREFEKLNNLNHTSIIALSGYNKSEVSQNAGTAKMDDYIIKPINEAELLIKIKDLIKNKQPYFN